MKVYRTMLLEILSIRTVYSMGLLAPLAIKRIILVVKYAHPAPTVASATLYADPALRSFRFR